MKNRFVFLALILINVVIIIGVNARFFNNVLALIAFRGYEIPIESSMFTFEPTVMNSGSGEWWIYGKDNINFYCAEVYDEKSYILISKKRSKNIIGFNPIDYKTWNIDKNTDK